MYNRLKGYCRQTHDVPWMCLHCFCWQSFSRRYTIILVRNMHTEALLSIRPIDTVRLRLTYRICFRIALFPNKYKHVSYIGLVIYCSTLDLAGMIISRCYDVVQHVCVWWEIKTVSYMAGRTPCWHKVACTLYRASRSNMIHLHGARHDGAASRPCRWRHVTDLLSPSANFMRATSVDQRPGTIVCFSFAVRQSIDARCYCLFARCAFN